LNITIIYFFYTTLPSLNFHVNYVFYPFYKWSGTGFPYHNYLLLSETCIFHDVGVVCSRNGKNRTLSLAEHSCCCIGGYL